MKFDFCIGNPPYQEDTQGESHTAISVYNSFMDAAFEVADKVELITPARFLMNAGNTPKAWNKKMLEDPHLKPLWHEPISENVFPGVSIPGGLAVTYRDRKTEFGAIGIYTPFPELRSIREKVAPFLAEGSIRTIIYQQNRFYLDKLYADYPDAKKQISSNGRERRIVSTELNKVKAFSNSKHDDADIRILGIENGNKRVYKWINKKYVEDNGNTYKYKVIVSMSNGASGTLERDTSARIISRPQVDDPGVGFTETFLSVGAFEKREYAENAFKYLLSKFARVMLGVLKVTQHNTPEKWEFVPLQDFTSKSDINWNTSIKNIDRQLYKKYNLTNEEIDFIETHVKEME